MGKPIPKLIAMYSMCCRLSNGNPYDGPTLMAYTAWRDRLWPAPWSSKE